MSRPARGAALAFALVLFAICPGCASIAGLWGGGQTVTESAQSEEETRLNPVTAWRKTIDDGRNDCTTAENVADLAVASGKVDAGERKTIQVGIDGARRSLRLANGELANFLNGIAEEASVESKVATAAKLVVRVKKTTADVKLRESLDPDSVKGEAK